jgi:hypothetical protein
MKVVVYLVVQTVPLHQTEVSALGIAVDQEILRQAVARQENQGIAFLVVPEMTVHIVHDHIADFEIEYLLAGNVVLDFLESNVDLYYQDIVLHHQTVVCFDSFIISSF